MKVLVFGSCNIDHVYSLDHIVERGETEMTCSYEIFPGGKGLNQAIAAARAGADVYFAGCVGCDGAILTDILTASGVDISLANKLDEPNGHAIIQVGRDGDNSIFVYPGSNEKISKEYVNSVLSHFDSGDFIILQNEINNVGYIIEKAAEKGMNIVLNPSPFNEKAESLDFSRVSYLVVNELEIAAISRGGDAKDSLDAVRQKYPGLKIILTLGSDGSIYADNRLEVRRAAFAVNAVDTTAAGDTFTGYFVAELTRNAEYADALRVASAAAALSVAKKGAAISIPLIDEVCAVIDTLREI